MTFLSRGGLYHGALHGADGIITQDRQSFWYGNSSVTPHTKAKIEVQNLRESTLLTDYSSPL